MAAEMSRSTCTCWCETLLREKRTERKREKRRKKKTEGGERERKGCTEVKMLLHTEKEVIRPRCERSEKPGAKGKVTGKMHYSTAAAKLLIKEDVFISEKKKKRK